MNYYNEIKDILISNETYKLVKDYSKNKNELNSYFEVGKLLVEAQGGETRAKYGNKLIKEYSERLTKDLGKGYSIPNLKKMRKFYLIIRKGSTLSSQLTWSHYAELLKLKDIKEISYYIHICEEFNLSVRILRERIKSNEYERIDYKEELEEPKVNTLIKNPIIIKTPNGVGEKVTEKILHQLILEDIDSFLRQLGTHFLYYGHEVKIKIGNNYHSIDFLLFNACFNCYVVLEVKVTKFNEKYVGQVLKYMGYVDKHIKEGFHNKTIGIIMCKEDDKLVLNYINPNGIYTTTYKILKEII